MVYYNEIDPAAAAWLRELIRTGLIAPGDVDERDIRDVSAGDLRGYHQCHWFAGIGTWSWALRQAGWADDREVWTGSCPCQPFSVAGKQSAFNDERHLWPAWFELIRACRPPVIFGEQVASAGVLGKSGGSRGKRRAVTDAGGDPAASVERTWLDVVQADLESASYAVGAVDLPAAGVGAPHIRQRLWFVADAHFRDGDNRRSDSSNVCGQQRREANLRGSQSVLRVARDDIVIAAIRVLANSDGGTGRQGGSFDRGRHTGDNEVSRVRSGSSNGIDHGADGDAQGVTVSPGLEGHDRNERDGREPGRLDTNAVGPVAAPGGTSIVDHALGDRRRTGGNDDKGNERQQSDTEGVTRGFWRDAEWIYC